MTERRKKIELFRLRIHDSLFDPQKDADRKAMLASCIKDTPCPVLNLAKGWGVWRVGNVEAISDSRICFKFGKIASRDNEYYDENVEKFIESSDDQADHTSIYMDVDLQLVGIVANSKLASKTGKIAENLGRALSVKLGKYTVNLGPIRDPKEFVKQLLKSHAVRSFSVTYKQPNQNLSSDDLYQTLSTMTKKSGADESTLSTKSRKNIKNRRLLARYAKNANATGYEAKARVIESEDSGPKIITLGEDSASTWVTQKEQENPNHVLEKIISFFKKITKNSQENGSDDEK